MSRSIHRLAVTVLFPGKGAEVDRLSVSAKDGVCCLENDQLYSLRGYLTHQELGITLYYIRINVGRFTDARRVNARVRVGISLSR